MFYIEVFKLFHIVIYCEYCVDTVRIEYNPSCIVCKTIGYCVRLYVSIVFNYRLLCASYMVSYGDLVSIILSIN